MYAYKLIRLGYKTIGLLEVKLSMSLIMKLFVQFIFSFSFIFFYVVMIIQTFLTLV